MVKRTVSVPGPSRRLPLRRCSPRFIGRPESVKEARNWLDRVLRAEGVPGEATDTALLLLSELASNNVKHAPNRTAVPGDFYVRAHLFHGRVRVEVRDAHGRRPVLRTVTPDTMAESGHGLVLVNALADCWGRCRSTLGPGMFFELRWDAPQPVAPVVPLQRKGW
ncbi:ATP-binding protein [Nocardiopsis xinjiangensis]|uniref:ATP-binding protein n=1 Tax=Nocardiopsis xinjiangensis TaxID=124285 RepID=UPI000348D584|nr:ATP-binding protein [Nocardiopsis xinjiangensis]